MGCHPSHWTNSIIFQDGYCTTNQHWFNPSFPPCSPNHQELNKGQPLKGPKEPKCRV